MIKNAQNILITGASSGIGQALAVYYAQNGAKNLFICGRNSARLAETVKSCEQYGVKVYGKIINVTEKATLAEGINECEKIAPLHLVIANAGVATLSEIPNNVYNTFTYLPSFINEHEISYATPCTICSSYSFSEASNSTASFSPTIKKDSYPPSLKVVLCKVPFTYPFTSKPLCES